jgi:hypothetical protein
LQIPLYSYQRLNPCIDILFREMILHSFLTTAPQQANVAGNILLFFYKKKTKQNKKNNKILPTTSACCRTVVRNECKDHFSFANGRVIITRLSFCLLPTTSMQFGRYWDCTSLPKNPFYFATIGLYI